MRRQNVLAAGLALLMCAPSALMVVAADLRPMEAKVEILTLDGKSAPLSEFKARVTVVNFWASWCFPCRYEMPLLQKIHDRFKSQGLSVVAIAIDDELPNARAYQSKGQFTFPMLFDGRGVTKRVFGVESVPETYIVGTDGALVPFRDPATGKVSTLINNPMVWEGQEIIELLTDLVSR